MKQPLQMLGDGIESGVLRIGRAAKLNAGGASRTDMFFQLLHQAGLANPWLTAEQHHLVAARFGLLPALPQKLADLVQDLVKCPDLSYTNALPNRDKEPYFAWTTGTCSVRSGRTCPVATACTFFNVSAV